jgi:ribonuclease-3 family protein
MRPELINPQALAYLGDAVFEVLVREYLLIDCNITKTDDLQKAAVKYVSAQAQADFMRYAIDKGLLAEEEIVIFKRGRNSKGRRSVKNVSAHNQSTGFEALIGHLYLQNNQERIKKLFKLYNEHVEFVSFVANTRE